MAQPDNFGFGEDAALLKDSARKFFADNFTTDKLHKMVASDHNPERKTACAWDQTLWQQMVDLGWTSLAVPESVGKNQLDDTLSTSFRQHLYAKYVQPQPKASDARRTASKKPAP